MPKGVRIKHSELNSRMDNLDIDEGIRIESQGKKIFVNRRASGDYVVQDGRKFHYVDSAAEVIALVKPQVNATIWFY